MRRVAHDHDTLADLFAGLHQGEGVFMARANLLEIFSDYDAEEHQSYVDLWFEESSQTALKAMIASLKK